MWAASLSFRFILLAAGVGAVVTDNAEIEFWSSARCELECVNDGHCRFLHGTSNDLSRIAQSGGLVQTCHCPPEFTGTTCQYLASAETVPSERKCHVAKVVTLETSNSSIYTTEPASSGCDCALADSLSEFAGRMCRRPVTEYCSGKLNIDESSSSSSISFCTNGGRCRHDIFGAASLLDSAESERSNLRNTNENASGCICPSDFYGPHCEFLRTKDSMDESSVTEQENYIFDIKATRDSDKQKIWEANDSSSTSPPSLIRTSRRPMMEISASNWVIFVLFVSLGTSAILVHVNRTVRKKSEKTTSLAREWNEEPSLKFRRLENCQRIRAWYHTLRRRWFNDRDTTGLWREWDDRPNSIPCKNLGHKVGHYSYSYGDEGETFDDEGIDEGIIVPSTWVVLDTICEDEDSKAEF